MFFEEGFELCFCFCQFLSGDGKGREVAEFAELFFEWAAEMISVCSGKSEVAEAVEVAFTGTGSLFSGGGLGGH